MKLQQKRYAEMFVVSKSKYGFDDTVAKVSEQIAAKGWKVSAVHDFQEILRKSGKEILPVKVVELCNPEYSAKLLVIDELRAFSALLPCRISVYATSDNEVYLSRMNSNDMVAKVDGKLKEIMGQAFGDVEAIASSVSV